MSINIIVATDLRFGIGKENALPWPHNKRDMTRFKTLTMGDIVVMGRKTWESIDSKPLPGRKNIVISSSKTLEGPDLTMGGDLGENLKYLQSVWPDTDIWIMGGSEIYKQAIPYADLLYLTTMNRQYDCDTHIESDVIVQFPVIDYWTEDEEMTFQVRKKL